MIIPILIPAYKPDYQLLSLIDRLTEAGVTDIIIVDDGSGTEYEEIFNQIRNNNHCKVCTHAFNLGKGRAIKTGLNFILANYPELKGVVTADADGQHLPADIIKVRNKLMESGQNLILGCRSFDRNIPLRSKLGNEITKIVFHLATGVKVSDTQTGLRGIPFKYIPECLKLDGERYEYEINVLASCGKNRISIEEVPVETVYIEQNRSSHFNPVLDSIKIYFVLFRFVLSSLSTALVDFIVFIICTKSGLSTLMSIIMSRLVSGNYNFIINKKIVFKSESNVIFSFIKYWLLVVLLGSLSYLGIQTLVKYLQINLILSKAIVETLLFFISFAVQRNLIFLSKES
ncbi:MAG: bifunctional glycosyltransferase family 2/GtrA family protein [Bacteroidia bacterium]|nr:bifunctional glycosyltransferase family 2/GtrA family protein [Bacteroidia bacterium]